MSAIDFGNRDGWRRWRAMPDDLRERAEAATVDLLAEMLDEPGRVTFPDWPVVEDDREVEWLACDIALSVARCSGDRSAPMLDRWCTALQRGKAEVAEERAAFLRGAIRRQVRRRRTTRCGSATGPGWRVWPRPWCW